MDCFDILHAESHPCEEEAEYFTFVGYIQHFESLDHPLLSNPQYNDDDDDDDDHNNNNNNNNNNNSNNMNMNMNMFSTVTSKFW